MNDFRLEEAQLNGQDTGENVKTAGAKARTLHHLGIKIITNESSFYQISDEWELLAQQADAPVFMSFDWVSSWWKYFGRHPKRRLFILTFYDVKKLVCVVPFFEGKATIGRLCLKKRISLAGSGVGRNELLGFKNEYGRSDFLDAIVHPDYKKQVAERLAIFLRRIYRFTDTIRFPHISEESFIFLELVPELRKNNVPVHLWQSDICPFLTVPDNFKEYIGTRSQGVKRRFRQTLRSIGPDKWYIIEDVSSMRDIKRGLSVLRELHQNRWNNAGYPGQFSDRRFARFLVEIAEKAATHNNLWFKLAKRDEDYCAARLVFKYNGRYYDYVTGFDDESEASKRRPGIGLLIDLIEDTITDHGKTIELLRGHENYKNDFTSEYRTNWKLEIKQLHTAISIRTIRNGLLDVAASCYAALIHERNLIHVHFRKAGIPKMVFSYIQFRWNSLIMKIRKRGNE